MNKTNKQIQIRALKALSISAALLLSACSSNPETQINFSSPPPIKSTAPAPSVQRANMLKKLQPYATTVTYVGDSGQFNIPAQYMFFNNTVNMKSQSSKILSYVSAYINTLKVKNVKVSVDSSRQSDRARAVSITSARAEKIVTQLRVSGLKARVAFGEGRGDLQPITRDHRVNSNNSKNNRISIRFERIMPTQGLLQ